MHFGFERLPSLCKIQAWWQASWAHQITCRPSSLPLPQGWFTLSGPHSWTLCPWPLPSPVELYVCLKTRLNFPQQLPQIRSPFSSKGGWGRHRGLQVQTAQQMWWDWNSGDAQSETVRCGFKTMTWKTSKIICVFGGSCYFKGWIGRRLKLFHKDINHRNPNTFFKGNIDWFQTAIPHFSHKMWKNEYTVRNVIYGYIVWSHSKYTHLLMWLLLFFAPTKLFHVYFTV